MIPGDKIELVVVIEVPDPSDPKTGGSLEKFRSVLEGIVGMWAGHMSDCGLTVYEAFTREEA